MDVKIIYFVEDGYLNKGPAQIMHVESTDYAGLSDEELHICIRDEIRQDYEGKCSFVFKMPEELRQAAKVR
jgi:hypothetical protein